MDTNEKAIIDYLKGCPGSFVSGKEIAVKAAGREQYEKNRGWAIPILAHLVRASVIETDFLGHFKFKPKEDKKKHGQKHVSPQVLKILKSSGKLFDGIIVDDGDDKDIYAYKPLKSAAKPGQPDKQN